MTSKEIAKYLRGMATQKMMNVNHARILREAARRLTPKKRRIHLSRFKMGRHEYPDEMPGR